MSKLQGVLPWTRSCFVCGEANPHGLHLRSRIEGDRVVLDYTTRESDLGYRHIVHGGLAITLLDEIMTWAAIVNARRACVAAEVTARLKKPIGVGQVLRAEAWVTKSSSRVILVESELKSPEGDLFLLASGKYMPMPEAQVHLTAKDFIVSPDALHPDDIMTGG
ncbi:MAG TPA: hypothetical protein DCZ95_16805 [Verrucomicrobia bacterium]|nr:MAG: hypothetical protein A2X46_09295 [Lentisphaerae bacterium GWF2_57_35]HBA85744.1 hypothetical protein [Verrucomicrobiota bacterium]